MTSRDIQESLDAVLRVLRRVAASQDVSRTDGAVASRIVELLTARCPGGVWQLSGDDWELRYARGLLASLARPGVLRDPLRRQCRRARWVLQQLDAGACEWAGVACPAAYYDPPRRPVDPFTVPEALTAIQIAGAWSRAISLLETIEAADGVRPSSRALAAVLLRQLKERDGAASRWALSRCSTMGVVVIDAIRRMARSDDEMRLRMEGECLRTAWELGQVAAGEAVWVSPHSCPRCPAATAPWRTPAGRVAMGRLIYRYQGRPLPSHLPPASESSTAARCFRRPPFPVVLRRPDMGSWR